MSTSQTLARVGRVALDLLYPPRCAVCGRHDDFLCASCFDGLPRADGARCDVCWSPLGANGRCRACSERELALTRLRAVFRYEGEVRRLVHAFKFAGHSALTPYLARPMLESLWEHGLEVDLVVPVPLTGLRRRRRGFNQAALLGREMAKGAGLPFEEPLSRRRFPGPQARSASAIDRQRNVEGAFAVSKPEAVADRRVLLIDDITTTGATLDACARVLLAAGAGEVSALTFARED